METEENEKVYKYICTAAVVAGAIIILLVLFTSPMPGVADQGDFERVMRATGLEETDRKLKSYEQLWFKYVVPEYKMKFSNIIRLAGILPTTSMIYPITITKLISRLTGSGYFNTKTLAAVYSIMYIAALYMCFKYIKIKNICTRIFFIILSLFILMDGNYLVWFNSLYGESMMIIGLIMFISAMLYTINSEEEKSTKKLFFMFAGGVLFLGSKLQCFSALPLILLLIFRMIYLQGAKLSPYKLRRYLAIPTFILLFYVGGIYVQISSTCGEDTKYNSVFYGVLMISKSPEKDLAVLGLPADMALDAGKHAYLPKDQYVKYVPWSDTTKTEFNEKISNTKLLKFYLLQPKKLIEGMEYTASKAFDTGTSLGKFEKSDISEYTYKLNRFTLWSDIRNTKFPKKLIFIATVYLIVVSVSIIEYIKRKDDKRTRLNLELLWSVMLIGLLQFPMPFIGNGEADTAKQLFLFNFTFDIVILVSFTWIFDKVYKRITG